jgi:NADPH:quinone reductase-like Zn-dependent oxidoreductase
VHASVRLSSFGEGWFCSTSGGRGLSVRAAIFYEFGGVDVLRVEDVPRPVPGEGEVLVAVKACALNRLDIWVRMGLPIETTMPHIGGSDIAGVVEELGSGVAGVKVGARVVINPSLSCGRCEWCLKGEECLCDNFKIIGEHTQGGLAEYVVAPAQNLFEIPAQFDFVRASAVPLPYATAWRGLMTRARLGAGDSVLVTGASGGVSTAAIQIAKLAGAKVFAVTTTENVERVKALGADVVYDRNAVDYAKEIWRDTGKRGVDVILDSIGEATWKQNVRALAKCGRLVVYGGTTGPKAEIDVRLLFWRQLEILGTTMSNRAEFETVMTHVFAGDLQPVVDREFPLADVTAAMEYLEMGKQFGKVVVVP